MTYTKDEARGKITKLVEDFRAHEAMKKSERQFDLAVSDFFKGRSLL